MNFDHLRFGCQLVNGFRTAHEKRIAQMRARDLLLGTGTALGLRVLDLANGRLRPQYRILRSEGYRVYGIDVANKPASDWIDYAYKMARFFYGLRITVRGSKEATLVNGDVSILPFRDCTMDIVTSVAAFEHFLNVPRVIAELYRVLKPGGFVWVLVHLFTSPSGGHNVSLSQIPLRTIPRGVEPWDHLRKRRLPFHVPLNEWRKDQYVEEFGKQFEIVKHYCAMREGEDLLTPQIERELAIYSRDELTCGSYVIVARKGSAGRSQSSAAN